MGIKRLGPCFQVASAKVKAAKSFGSTSISSVDKTTVVQNSVHE